jgi:hypothetical protein
MKATYNFLFFLSMLSAFSYSQEITVTKETVTQEPQTIEPYSENGFDFFASEEPLQMTLSFDIREFVKTKKSPEYLDATLTVMLHENDSISQHIKLRARGEMRCKYCSFPPIMLKFKDKINETEPIQSNMNIKLVTHCNKSVSFENYLFKEYLAYKLYNLVTPYSFRTRLVVINYIDVNNPDNTFTEYGFLIENAEQMASRNNAMVIDNLNVAQKHMNAAEMARVAVFNYMIGNTDWSVQQQHNVKVLRSLDVGSDKGIPVSYDFDYSGFVNTRYSTPSSTLPIKNVTDRYYMGTCYSDEELTTVINEFDGMKEEILGLVKDFEYLSRGSKKQAESYINSFYKTQKFPNALISDLNRTCMSY